MFQTSEITTPVFLGCICLVYLETAGQTEIINRTWNYRKQVKSCNESHSYYYSLRFFTIPFRP